MRRKKILRKKPFKRKKIFKLSLIIILILLVSLIFLVQFTQKKSPKIFISSPENKTYNINDVILNVSTVETVKWIANSFDEREKIIECYDCNGYIRYDLFFENGTHTITVYAEGYNNRISSKSITFTVII